MPFGEFDIEATSAQRTGAASDDDISIAGIKQAQA
jgi:hypothetical protein